MDIRPITPEFAVSPQIAPEDIAAIREAGFDGIICNRPDAEVPAAIQAQAVQAAAEAAGLRFVLNPVTNNGLNMEMVEIQREAAATGKVLAYCASGTRSSVVWALSQAGQMEIDDILSATAAAGYDLAGMRPQLMSLV